MKDTTMKEAIEIAIAYHRDEAERINTERSTTMKHLAQSGAFDADQLLAYGNKLKSLEAEMREHSRVLGTLNMLLRKS